MMSIVSWFVVFTASIMNEKYVRMFADNFVWAQRRLQKSASR